uniref:Dipeptidase n=1 Tax=Ficedula albicollis TaxID=59894 RepID=A0A803WAA1_FICAL
MGEQRSPGPAARPAAPSLWESPSWETLRGQPGGGSPGRAFQGCAGTGSNLPWGSPCQAPQGCVGTGDSFPGDPVGPSVATLSLPRHNDLPWQLLRKFNNQLGLPEANLTVLNDTHTNIPKLRQGRVGGQFWSVYVPCETQNKDAVRRTLEQMDVVQRMCDLYPDTFACVTDTEGIRQAFTSGKVASLMGVEGGHSIDSSLGVLRSLYRLGARYMTLTHSCNTPWADNWLVDTKDEKPVHHGLSAFGKMVVQEMNRLGMIVDLAHVSVDTMKAVLNISKAPIIFSHSSAYGICPHRRNVPDDVLRLVVSVGTAGAGQGACCHRDPGTVPGAAGRGRPRALFCRICRQNKTVARAAPAASMDVGPPRQSPPLLAGHVGPPRHAGGHPRVSPATPACHRRGRAAGSRRRSHR